MENRWMREYRTECLRMGLEYDLGGFHEYLREKYNDNDIEHTSEDTNRIPNWTMFPSSGSTIAGCVLLWIALFS
jgi:hypothetical protein